MRPYLRREMGWPLSELGRIRLRKGDVEGAEQALLAAHQAGWDPQPGLALVRLAQGDVATAAASIRDALEHPLRVPSKERPPDTDLQRAPLLEAQVEIEIAAANLDRARSAADDLERAGRFQSKALVASATLARGRVRLAEGDAANGERMFSEAARLWNEVGAPYEAALARMGLAEALRASGYRRRLAEIDDDIEQARALGDTDRAAQADAERDFLVRELSSAVGLGGRDRRAASASERARAGVTRAIRQAIARIGEHHPELGEHLNLAIRTGTYCA